MAPRRARARALRCRLREAAAATKPSRCAPGRRRRAAVAACSPTAVGADPQVPARHEGDNDEAASVHKKRAREDIVVGSEVELAFRMGAAARVLERSRDKRLAARVHAR